MLDFTICKSLTDCVRCSYLVSNSDSIFHQVSIKKGEHSRESESKVNYLFVCISGKVKISYKENCTYAIAAKEFMAIPRNEALIIKALEDAEVLIMSFHSETIACGHSNLERCQLQLQQRKTNTKPTTLKLHKTLEDVFISMLKTLKKGINCLHYQKSIQSLVLIMIEMHYSKNDILNFILPLYNEAFNFRTFIYKHFNNVESVNELIELSNLSRSTFYQTFKEEFGIPAKQWILKQRAKLIKEKFIHSDLTIKEIMFSFHFQTASEFTRFCKTYLGKTPTTLLLELRKNITYA